MAALREPPASKTMRILHVYKDVYPPVAGGIERHIHSIRKALPQREHDVLVCARDRRTSYRSPGPEVSGYEVLVGQLGRVWSVPIAPTFPLWLQRMARGAVVHLHMPNPLSELSSLVLPSTTPVVASYHCDIFRQRVMMPVYEPLLLRCLQRAAKVVCGSTSLRDGSPVLSAIRRDIDVIPYGLDVDQWSSARVLRGPIESLHRRYGGPFIVSVGRLVSYKGFDRLIDVAANLPLPLVIIGDGPERARLQSQIVVSGLGGRVFLAGRISDEDLLTHLAAARIFVLASVNRAEAYGIAILEAQAASLPVVVTDVGTGTREAFAPGETGVLVPAEDSPRLIDAIRCLADNPELRERMATAGRRRVERINSLDALGRRLELVYRHAEASTEGFTTPKS